MDGQREPEPIATALAKMARDLLAQDSLQATLDRIVAHAVELVEGCEAAGILVLRGRSVRTLAASSELVEASDRLQGEVGEGPCFDATRRRTQVLRIADLNQQAERWPRFTPRARELGIGSMIGFQLFTNEQNLGSLNLYATRPGALTDRSEQVGWLLASHAAVAFATARSADELHAAIASRTEIGEATGILMERYKITDDEAFAVLSRTSQTRNTKLREIARQVVETGDVPGA